jgi:hypothetical protein
MQRSAPTAHRAGPRVRCTPRTAPRAACGGREPLGRYTGADGRSRELVAIDSRAGSVLVIDRDAITLADRRLVAHIAPDEPPSNVSLVCELYLADGAGRRCRPVVRADLEHLPGQEPGVDEALAHEPPASEPSDARGRLYRIETRLAGRSSELRWVRLHTTTTELARPKEPAPRREAAPRREVARPSKAGRPREAGPRQEVVSVREVVGSVQSYEPVRALTLAAIGAHASDPGVSVVKLRAELARLEASPIVLNRGLREALLRALRVQELSMSEIARRCGRVKRDSRGNESGEASWLGRRAGLLPEAGAAEPTPWVHSEVLGLIARRGLGLSPREVEL